MKIPPQPRSKALRADFEAAKAESDELAQLRQRLAGLETKVQQLTESRNRALEQIDTLLGMHNILVAELAYIRRCSRAWRRLAKKYRHRPLPGNAETYSEDDYSDASKQTNRPD